MALATAVLVVSLGTAAHGAGGFPQILGEFNFTSPTGRPMTDSQALAEVRRVWQLADSATDSSVRAEIRRRTLTQEPLPYARHPTLHVPAASQGCGLTPPARGDELRELNVTDPTLGRVSRGYRLHLPEHYDADVPTPLIFDFHAWGWSSGDQLETTGMNKLADARTAIIVYPEGIDDVVCPDCDTGSFSWNACGATSWRDSSMGPTCQWELDPAIPPAGYPCHTSCAMLAEHGCDHNDNRSAAGCDCATCADDGLFVEALLDVLEATLCIDTRRIHLTGMSNGAIMNYEATTGRGHPSLGRRIASVAPAAGAPLMGFNFPPHAPISLMDIRGELDNTVPANISNGWPAPWLPGQVEPGPNNSTLSGDGFFYTTIDNITSSWAPVLGCEGPQFAQHYPTRFDGISGFYCVAPQGRCVEQGRHHSLVRCFHTGGHTWPWRLLMLAGENYYAELVFDFFEAHPQQ